MPKRFVFLQALRNLGEWMTEKKTIQTDMDGDKYEVDEQRFFTISRPGAALLQLNKYVIEPLETIIRAGTWPIAKGIELGLAGVKKGIEVVSGEWEAIKEDAETTLRGNTEAMFEKRMMKKLKQQQPEQAEKAELN
ncbi:MAG: hypothetical protein Q8O95_05155 [bacterium]|nr:hypothetical protein [bacterium]